MIDIADHVYRIAVEERLKDELVIRNWWATTGKSLGWTVSTPRGVGRPGVMTDMQREHRARLRLLLSVAQSVRAAR